MSGRKPKAPAGHSKAPPKRSARGSTSMPTPGPGPTAETVTTPAQIAEEVTKTVLDYLQKNGLVAKATNDTDKVRETNVQQSQQTAHTNTTMNLETNNLNQGSSITSTAPPCRLDKTHFTSSRVPLHATVNLKKKEISGPMNLLSCLPCRRTRWKIFRLTYTLARSPQILQKRNSLLSSSGPMHLIYMLRSADLNIQRKPKDWLHTWGSSAALRRSEGAGTFTILTFVVSGKLQTMPGMK